jgi:hypothetical protein
MMTNFKGECTLMIYNLGQSTSEIQLGMAFMEQFLIQIRYGDGQKVTTFTTTTSASSMGTTMSETAVASPPDDTLATWLIALLAILGLALFIGFSMCIYNTCTKKKTSVLDESHTEDISSLDALDVKLNT